MSTFRNRKDSVGRWGFAIVLLVYTTCWSPPVWSQNSSQVCKPLLLLIEGGAESSRDGESVEFLANEIVPRYNQEGIPVVLMDNAFFWNKYTWLPSNGEDASQKLIRSRYWPIVMVGHSMGGATAYNLAQRVPTELVVTLDAVSFADRRRRPANARTWINVWVGSNYDNLPGCCLPIYGDGFGPDWDKREGADLDIYAGAQSHFDVKYMRIPVQSGHPFHGKVITDSIPK